MRKSIYKTPEIEARLMAVTQAHLDRWPVAHECLTVPTRYGATAVIACGDGQRPPLVLLHAMGLNATMWLPNAADLSRHYRLYALDTVGDLGKSRLAGKPPKDGAAYSDWLEDVFRELGIEKAHLIGSSMGGWIAHSMAWYAPQRLLKLVLLAPAAGVSVGQRWLPDLIRLMLFPTPAHIRRFSRWLMGDGSRVNEMWADYLPLAMQCRGKLGWPRKFSDEELGTIHVPTLLLSGAQEVVYDVKATTDRALRLIPSVQAEVIPGAGHLLNTDQPEIVNARILRFFSE